MTMETPISHHITGIGIFGIWICLYHILGEKKKQWLRKWFSQIDRLPSNPSTPQPTQIAATPEAQRCLTTSFSGGWHNVETHLFAGKIWLVAMILNFCFGRIPSFNLFKKYCVVFSTCQSVLVWTGLTKTRGHAPPVAKVQPVEPICSPRVLKFGCGTTATTPRQWVNV